MLPALLFALLAASPSATDVRVLQADRNVGLASLEEGNLAEAAKRFAEIRRLAPNDPLGWANGAVTAMRAKELATAEKLAAQALVLAPDDARVLAIEASTDTSSTTPMKRRTTPMGILTQCDRIIFTPVNTRMADRP